MIRHHPERGKFTQTLTMRHWGLTEDLEGAIHHSHIIEDLLHYICMVEGKCSDESSRITEARASYLKAKNRLIKTITSHEVLQLLLLV